MKTKPPIATEKIGSERNPDAIFFRFQEGTTRRSVQPDEQHFIFLELDDNGRLLGVLTYEPVNILVIEFLRTEITAGGITNRYEYELRLDQLIVERARLDLCHA